ncbi:flagellar biosynthesis protein FlgC [Neobacillus piezotolerans]|uniref:Flagellar biosynthesis protein FlgC n=1 Tax=Neobacillus piezotolerans TaxID=2259171 RepID=A0A3D8GPB2_9BACI|nr:flagellar hook-basal body protein [Neobacillus piezotolerans]RDU35916.1 flagellar biosynthesis protein FlgC [Neobacillus piezotolerans]
MLRGIDSAASGMIALQRKQDALTNNLANAETPGFKQDASPLRSFPEVLLQQIRGKESVAEARMGTLSMGVYNQETLPLFLQGTLTETNMPFDVAISDQGIAPIEVDGRTVKPTAFFAVQTSDGAMRLTRNGRFSVNENGELVTATGDFVLGKNGNRITGLDPQLKDVSINSDGDIIAFPNDPQRTRTIGSIGMVIVENPNRLIKRANGQFELDEPGMVMVTGNLPAGVQLHQKMLEQSNVDLSQTITDMMANIRLYEANQKVLQTYDKSLEQLNTIGRV